MTRILLVGRGVDSNGAGQIGAQPQEQREIADVAATHLSENLPPQLAFRQQVREPRRDPDANPARGVWILIEDLAKCSMFWSSSVLVIDKGRSAAVEE